MVSSVSALCADFIFSGVRHIRVLYYDGLRVPEDLQQFRAPEHENKLFVGSDANYNLAYERFLPFMRRAVDLVTRGFLTPVPFLENHSPVGRATVRVFNTYPEIARRGSYIYMATLSGDGLIFEPEGNFHGTWSCPGPMPTDLQDVIAGKKGEPAGPDVNEVSGRSLQEFITDHRWRALVKKDFWFNGHGNYPWFHYQSLHGL